MTKQMTLDGRTLSDEKRTYTFNLLNAKDGFKIFNNEITFIISILPKLFEALNIGGDISRESVISSLKNGIDIKANGANIFSLLQLLPEVLTTEKLEMLATKMLAGVVVKSGDETFTADDDGFGEYADGNPMEVYTAIAYGIYANYKKAIDPLFLDGEKDSPPTLETPKGQK